MNFYVKAMQNKIKSISSSKINDLLVSSNSFWDVGRKEINKDNFKTIWEPIKDHLQKVDRREIQLVGKDRKSVLIVFLKRAHPKLSLRH